MEYSKYFTVISTDSDDSMVVYREGSPDCFVDFVRKLHKNFYCFTPNNWLYLTILEAFEELEDKINVDIEDCSIESDRYCSNIIGWLQNPFALDFVNKILRSSEKYSDLIEIIMIAQIDAKTEVYKEVIYFLENEKKNAKTIIEKSIG